MDDPRLLFEKARSALGAGDSQAAAEHAGRLLAIMPGQPQALHLMAVAERRNGRLDKARSFFEAARAADPSNPEICNNYGNLLDDLNRPQDALDQYRAALVRAPLYADAWINIAVVCRKLEAISEGLEAAERGVELAPDNARAWLMLGMLRQDAGEGDGAGAAFERALELAPENPRALAAAAAFALERGLPATPAFDRALAVSPDDANLLLGRAASLHAAGQGETARDLLEQLIRAKPGLVEAHVMLAKLYLAAGERERADESFKIALRGAPADHALWLGLLRTYSRLSDYQNLARSAAEARRALGDDPAVLGFGAVAADELGDHDRAHAMLRALDAEASGTGDADSFAIALVRNLLRTGRAGDAAIRAEAAAERGSRAAWPYVATAWRMLEDPRWRRLEGDPLFFAAIDSPAAGALIDDLIPVLRRLHTDRAPPLGQTLQGGSQTEGALFLRRDPVLAALAAALMQAVTAYVDRLPPPQEGHPLLGSARRGLRYSGSWSVRLKGGGFHVNHVHPAGWISSAFYVSLPSTEAEEAAGVLTLGEPPEELRLGLAPFRTIEPKPGRLALFPSYTWHGTTPFAAGERITVAFDVVAEPS